MLYIIKASVMDLVTGLVCLVSVVASSVIIYLVLSISSVKENSFDEIKANRRKLLQQYKDETRLNSEKAKEKKSKKAKKAKEKQSETEKPTVSASVKDLDSQTDDEKENVQDHPNYESVVEQVVEVKPNKKEILPKPENFPKDINTTEEIENDHTSIDTVSGKSERKENKKSKVGGNAHKGEGNKKPVKVEKELVLKQVAQPSGDQPVAKDGDQPLIKSNIVQVFKPPMPQNSNKPKTVNSFEDDLLIKKCMFEEAKEGVIKEAIQPSVKEVQVKPLLQNFPKSGKKKKSEVASLQQLSSEKDAVNINLLMPLLQKAELSRSEIQLLIDALLNKQQEESSEWLKGRQDPLVKLKKQLAEKEKALADEQEASNGLQAKLKELRAELNAEKSNVRHLEDSVCSKRNEFKAISMKHQQVVDENQSLLAKNQQLQKQLNDEVMLVCKLKEEKTLQQNLFITREQHHEIIVSLQGSIASVGEENSILQERLRMQEEYNADLNRHLSNAQYEVKQFQSQLVDSRAERDKLSHLVQELQSKTDALLEENKHLSEQVPAACQENNHLETLKDNRENGDIYSSNQDHSSNLHSLLEEKETLLNQLNNELDEKENHIEQINNEIIACKNDANKKQTLLENANMELSKIKAQNSLLSSELKEAGAIINDLRNELAKKKEEVIMLRKDVDMHKQRNNELRNKNWKVAEALATAEQALQKSNQLRNISNSEEKNDGVSHLKMQITHLFQRIFPDIFLEDCKDIQVWLSKVEQAAVAAKENQPTSLNLSDLEAQNRQLQTMVSHYKAIINYTEGMLNSLQAHIEVEETRWGEKIEALQAELDLIKGNNPKKD